MGLKWVMDSVFVVKEHQRNLSIHAFGEVSVTENKSVVLYNVNQKGAKELAGFLEVMIKTGGMKLSDGSVSFHAKHLHSILDHMNSIQNEFRFEPVSVCGPEYIPQKTVLNNGRYTHKVAFAVHT
jgi:hypothetical protein